jgi:hypothetical protein
MWRRIHSKRDPSDTLYSELKKEFGTYFGAVNSLMRKAAESYPRFLFGIMVLLMTVSLVLSFTVFRHPEPARPPVKNVRVNPVEEGFGQIMQATGKIRETIRLKHLVDSISAKKQFSAADSTALDSALSRLQQIHQ